MNDGKPTGSKARWWSRPTQRGGGSAAEETYDLAPPAGAQPTPPDADAEAYPLAEGVPVEDESAYRLAPPAPSAPVGQTGAAEPDDAPQAPPSEISAEPVDAAARTAAAVDGSTEAADGDAAAQTPGPVDGSTEAAEAGEVTGTAEVTEAAAPVRPLHAPDPYGTPPYGGPGPWAPAPPVQRPTPPGAPVVPPQAAYPAPPEAVAPLPQPGAAYPAPEGVGVPQASPSSQWAQYDPWGAGGGQPLSSAGVPQKAKSRRGALVLGAVALALVAGGIGGGVGAYVERNGGVTHVDLPQAGKGPVGRAPDSVAGIAASALPSVVTLHVSGASESGTGTGFVLDTAGHILTNNHVVEPAGSSGDISVTFSGGESARAEVVGRDSGYDLAVVRVTGVSGLKPLPLGNSENVQVGDPVVAIGAPFDLSNTVTSGIISAKERPITAGGEKGDGSDVSYVDALQTDAPINPGNSGGPLLDSRAHVVGINSAIRAAGNSDSGGQGGSIGLGFAIPINQGKRVAEELINTGKATHPVIGVTLDMKYTGDGARVGAKAADGKPSVTPDGPGAAAGIKPEDVITKVDGQRVHSAEELIVKIRAHRPGDRLELTLKRGGQEQRLTLTLGSATS
ncbi:trypsin-like peptidase domain-containing protein [Streptomyces sp. NPDC020719]|uniref:trypsin-like peptidase domain-containing protein n=1 Tax=Streptomyces sp. NPDC020719 TaxID=3154896 RepID=UPI0033F73CC3